MRERKRLVTNALPRRKEQDVRPAYSIVGNKEERGVTDERWRLSDGTKDALSAGNQLAGGNI